MMVFLHRDHGRFIDNDTLTFQVDQGIGRTQVNRQIVGEHSKKMIKQVEHRLKGLLSLHHSTFKVALTLPKASIRHNS